MLCTKLSKIIPVNNLHLYKHPLLIVFSLIYLEKSYAKHEIISVNNIQLYKQFE